MPGTMVFQDSPPWTFEGVAGRVDAARDPRAHLDAIEHLAVQGMFFASRPADQASATSCDPAGFG